MLSNITTVETTDSGEREMNPVAMNNYLYNYQRGLYHKTTLCRKTFGLYCNDHSNIQLFIKQQNFRPAQIADNKMKGTEKFEFKFKHIYFTSIKKQVLITYTNLSRFCFLGTTPVLAPNVWANEKSQS